MLEWHPTFNKFQASAGKALHDTTVLTPAVLSPAAG